MKPIQLSVNTLSTKKSSYQMYNKQDKYRFYVVNINSRVIISNTMELTL